MPLAVRYLARRDRTAAQVEHFLRTRGASPVQVKHIIGRLSDLRYLNDRAYAERWIESSLARRPMGRERLVAGLLAKGVTEEVAGRTVREALRNLNDEALARQALSNARRKDRRLTPVQSVRLLRQRGFEEETIERIVRVRAGQRGVDL